MADDSGPGGPSLQLAQAGGPIGTVTALTGTAGLTRQGESLALAPGDPVFEGDLLETGPAGAVTIVFTDGTTFSLSPEARMTLESYLYAPEESGNALGFDLLEGGFVFITGALADQGRMAVETPVAVIGIRGTTPAVQVSAEPAGGFAILPDPDGVVGSYDLLDPESGALIAVVDDPATLTTIAAPGAPPLVRPLAPEEITDFYILRNRGLESVEPGPESPREDDGLQDFLEPNDGNDRDPGGRDRGQQQGRAPQSEDAGGEAAGEVLAPGELFTDLGGGPGALFGPPDAQELPALTDELPQGGAASIPAGAGDPLAGLLLDPAAVDFAV